MDQSTGGQSSKHEHTKTFKVSLILDHVETEVMLVKAGTHREAARIARAALVSGKKHEGKKWQLRITEHPATGEPGKRAPRKKRKSDSS